MKWLVGAIITFFSISISASSCRVWFSGGIFITAPSKTTGNCSGKDAIRPDVDTHTKKNRTAHTHTHCLELYTHADTARVLRNAGLGAYRKLTYFLVFFFFFLPVCGAISPLEYTDTHLEECKFPSFPVQKNLSFNSSKINTNFF